MMKRHHFMLHSIIIFMALICLSPFYFLIINALKPIKDILLNPAAFPRAFFTGNFVQAYQLMNFPKAFFNSTVITFLSVGSIVIVSSMASYRLVRHKSRLNQVVFILFVSAMVIPFQSIMIPMVRVVDRLGWINRYYGVVCTYLGFGVSFATFLFHGFIKTVPLDIEEAASIDGCSPLGIYWRIVFPLLKPVIVTVIILDSFWIWNDFLLPLLVIPKESMRTIPLALNSFFSQYTKKWDLAMAALIMSIVPVVIIFVFLQKHIIHGIVSGSVKG